MAHLSDDEDMAGGWSEFRSGWKVVLAGFAGLVFGAPTLASYSIGILAPHLAKAFGWSYSLIFSGLTLLAFAFLPLAPLIGMVVDRYGPRLVASVSLLLFGLSYMLLGLSTGSPAQYLATWVLLAVSGVGATAITFTRAINAVFRKRRGFALGLALSGTGLCIIFMKLTGQPIIDRVGWRLATVLFGLLPIVLALPLVVWATPGKIAPTVSVTENVAKSEIGLTFGQAIRGKAFWILLLAFAPVAFCAASFPNLENILALGGVPRAGIPAITALIGVAMIIGRLVGGYVIDRFWAPLISYLIVAITAVAFIMLSQPVIPVWQASIATIFLGFGGGVEMDLLAYLVVRYLGLKSYGSLYGFLYAMFFVVAGAAPAILGGIYDRTHTYSVFLWWTGWGVLTFGAVILLLGRYPRLEEVPAA